MVVDKELNIAFEKAFEKASKMEEALPQDTMLLFYAYYKQATSGDNFSFNANFGVRNAFKFNAWMQLKGLSNDEAKRKYIDLVEKHIK